MNFKTQKSNWLMSWVLNKLYSTKQWYYYLREGATKEDAALWRTLTPIKRIKDALSCSKTYFTVVPVNINALQWQTLSLGSSYAYRREKKIPFSEAIRSEIHVLDTTRKATASNCTPCLSSTVGTWKTTSLAVNKSIYEKFVVADQKRYCSTNQFQLEAFDNPTNVKNIELEERNRQEVTGKKR